MEYHIGVVENMVERLLVPTIKANLVNSKRASIRRPRAHDPPTS